jgi:hypothetical protein
MRGIQPARQGKRSEKLWRIRGIGLCRATWLWLSSRPAGAMARSTGMNPWAYATDVPPPPALPRSVASPIQHGH